MQTMLRATEAAQLLNTSIATVYDLVRKKQIPFVRFSERRIRFSQQSLEQWLKERECGNQNRPAESGNDTVAA